MIKLSRAGSSRPHKYWDRKIGAKNILIEGETNIASETEGMTEGTTTFDPETGKYLDWRLKKSCFRDRISWLKGETKC